MQRDVAADGQCRMRTAKHKPDLLLEIESFIRIALSPEMRNSCSDECFQSFRTLRLLEPVGANRSYRSITKAYVSWQRAESLALEKINA